MGKGGKKATGNEVAALNDGEWKSPFTPELYRDKKAMEEKLPTKSELRAVIPKRCFERSLFWSSFYVLQDVLQGIIVVYITHQVIGLSVDPPEEGFFGDPMKWLIWRLAWNLYAVAMTLAVGGLWVIGHECGHGAFSKYPIVNDSVGFVLHTAMLVPYFTWAFSHAKHHRRTNDLIDGETHVPDLGSDLGLNQLMKKDNGEYEYERVSNDIVQREIYGCGGIKQFFTNHLYGQARLHEKLGDEGFAMFVIWYRLFFMWQLYLVGSNSHGRNGADSKPILKGTFPDHFRPHSRMFPEKMYWKVLASDAGVLAVIGALIYCSFQYSLRAVWFWYFGPYLLITAFLVAVTWLQHSDPSVPHLDTENWTWMKGALAGTIDRPLEGWALHDISTTHVVHHLFHEIPHYRAKEATKAIREYLEPKGLYNFDPTPPLEALWKIAKRCHFVDGLEGVQYYKSLEDVPRRYGSAQSKKDC